MTLPTVDIRQTAQYANYLRKLGWTVERIDKVNYFIKKFPLVGSVIKIQRPQKIRYKDIKILSDKYRAFQVIVEPKNTSQQQTVISNQFKLSKSAYVPTKTLHLDLTLSMNRLISSMKKDAKLAIRKNDQFTINNLQLKEVKKFGDAWKKAVGWRRYVPPLTHLFTLKKSFGNNALFLLANNGSSGAIFLTSKDVGYYWQAFTNKEGRKLGAQYKIVWEGIKWAKKKGAKVFDFEGIYDRRFPNKSWLGFTHFKKSFGGYEVEYPGAFVKNRFPFVLD